jgi:argininosuccinate synthase
MSAPKKVVLAYSGGLDTSIILKWLQTEYGCEVVTFTADLGQGEELEPARKKAEMLGVKPRTSTSRTCARNSCATSSSRCSAPTRSTRGSTCSAPPSRGR